MYRPHRDHLIASLVTEVAYSTIQNVDLTKPTQKPSHVVQLVVYGLYWKGNPI